MAVCDFCNRAGDEWRLYVLSLADDRREVLTCVDCLGADASDSLAIGYLVTRETVENNHESEVARNGS